MHILFSFEKLFDIDGMYNSQNQHIWGASRAEGNERGGIKMKQIFPTEIMVWLDV